MTREEFANLILASNQKITDVSILRLVRLDDIRKMLEDAGWKLKDTTERWFCYIAPVKADNGEEMEMIVPIRDDFEDWGERIPDIIDFYNAVRDDKETQIQILLRLLVK